MFKNSKGEDAPTFWSEEKGLPKTFEKDIGVVDEEQIEVNLRERKQKIEQFADFMITTSADDIKCQTHLKIPIENCTICDDCNELRSKASKYQTHKHTFTCAKKRKTITIKSNEGHGKDDGHVKGPELRNIPVCRFNIPKFPR